MNPCDFDVFHRIKSPMKGRRYQNDQELMQDTEAQIEKINNNHELIGIQNLHVKWQEIIDNNGDYVVNN